MDDCINFTSLTSVIDLLECISINISRWHEDKLGLVLTSFKFTACKYSSLLTIDEVYNLNIKSKKNIYCIQQRKSNDQISIGSRYHIIFTHGYCTF